MEAFSWIHKLISITVFLQISEILSLHKVWSTNGIWRWDILKNDYLKYPKPIRNFLNFLLSEKIFLCLLIVSLLSTLANFYVPEKIFLIMMLISTLSIAIRWRGTFCGGSDYMTIVVLLSCTVASFFPLSAKIQLACLWYIGVQITLSYFIAGVVKIKNPDWRSGKTLQEIIKKSNYVIHPKAIAVSDSYSAMFLLSWLVIIFECLFPIAFVSPLWCLLFISAAFVFHILNFFVLGLNRFVFAWLSGYPALIFLVKSLFLAQI